MLEGAGGRNRAGEAGLTGQTDLEISTFSTLRSAQWEGRVPGTLAQCREVQGGA